MRKIVYCLFIILALLLLSGCAQKGVTAHEDFLNALINMDYATAYTYFSAAARQRAGAEDLERRYAVMINELVITKITVDNLALEHDEKADTAKATYNMHYIMDEDELSYQFEMPLVMEGGRWLVDWSPKLVAPGMDWGDTLRVVRLPSRRGEIFANDGEILAKNEAAVTVFINASKVESLDAISADLARILGISEQSIRKKLARSGDIRPVLSMLPDEFSADISEALLNIPGVGIDRKSFGAIRVYPLGRTLAHTIGYTGAINEDELKALSAKYPGRYTADSEVGKAGLELAYEEMLHGVDGREYYIADSGGAKKSTLYSIPARDGLDLRLTIDLGLQERLEEIMIYSLSSEQTGAAVVMNLETGYIRAMSSFPGFDPNLFVRGVSDEVWRQLNDEKNHMPLYNRLTQGLYPPGSVIKPFTAAAFLETGAITPDTVFSGKIEDDRWTPERSDWGYPPIKRVEIRYRPMPLNITNAMITSDNVFFAFAALETGAEAFLGYMDSLGMNESMPFDLPLATPHTYKEGTDFNIKFLADSGYGQGEMLITPVQMAAMFTALYGGDIMRPRVVDRLYRTEGPDYLIEDEFEPEPFRAGAIKQSTLDVIKPSLEKVMTDGTGHTLGMRNRRLAGKTGTAQVGNREVSWLAVYTLDQDEPLLAIVVIDPSGNVVKFDIVREILRYKGN